MNRLFFDDNLNWLRDTKPLRAVCRSTAIFPDASVDLEYLDPPFNASVVELIEALKKFLKSSPMMARQATLTLFSVHTTRQAKFMILAHW